MWTRKPNHQSRIWIFCDGGLGLADYRNLPAGDEAHPAPGAPAALHLQAGCAALVRNDTGAVLDWAWRTLPTVTSVEAEYAGLLLGIELAARHPSLQTIFVLDSEVVVGQMTGRYAVNSHNLRRWHQRATAAIEPLPGVGFRAVPRAWNALADALARQAGLPWAQLRAALEE